MQNLTFKRLFLGFGLACKLSLISLSDHVSAQPIDKSLFKNPTGNLYDQRVKRYGKCCKKASQNATILMLDTTDSLREEQLQFVIDNYAEYFRWNNDGDRFTVIIMGSKPSYIMDFKSICAPKPEHKIDKVMDPIRNI